MKTIKQLLELGFKIEITRAIVTVRSLEKDFINKKLTKFEDLEIICNEAYKELISPKRNTKHYLILLRDGDLGPCLFQTGNKSFLLEIKDKNKHRYSGCTFLSPMTKKEVLKDKKLCHLIEE